MTSKIRCRYDLEEQKYHIIFPPVTVPGVTVIEDVSVWLDEDDATGLVNALLKQGVEVELPQSDTYLSGKLEATELHLKDMRRLVLMENEKGEV